MRKPLPHFTFPNSSTMSLTKSSLHSARGKHFLLICPCFFLLFLLFQSSLQVTVTQIDLSLQCWELQWATEKLSSISSYIHACNQVKKNPQQTRAALVLGSFANPTEIWALVSRCCFNLQSARMLFFYLLDTPVPANIWTITILIKLDFVNNLMFIERKKTQAFFCNMLQLLSLWLELEGMY